ncbi:MAG: hypothetical protein V4773_15850 [Verrucomicrobiota bacterium]
MRPLTLRIAALFTVMASASLAQQPAAPASGSPTHATESKAISEIFTSKIVKVYSFTEDDQQYVSYVVTWKDHEVVVEPSRYSRMKEPLNVGDTIRCEMRQTHKAPGDTSKQRITFAYLSAAADSMDALLFEPNFVSPSPQAEQRRLEAVTSEVRRRRDLREEASQMTRGKSPQELAPTPPPKTSK